MLVLSRKANESIQVGTDIRITVVRITPNSVRIGIEAPRDQEIVRTELIVATDDDAIHESLSDVVASMGTLV